MAGASAGAARLHGVHRRHLHKVTLPAVCGSVHDFLDQVFNDQGLKSPIEPPSDGL